MEKPSPIFTAESLAAAQNELGDQASISDAMALCKSQYESTPEFKAAKREERRQATALRKELAALAEQEKVEERERRRNDYECQNFS